MLYLSNLIGGTMKKISAIILVILALALLLNATIVSAKAERTILAGTEHMYFDMPDRVWLADGMVQQRDVPLTATFDFGILKGTETQLGNATLDPVTGSGHVWGTVTYTDSATGITCSGTRQGKIINFLISAQIFARCSDGSLLKGILQDVNIVVPPGSPVPTEVHSDFNGELLRP
jgi:hypothetical protein